MSYAPSPSLEYRRPARMTSITSGVTATGRTPAAALIRITSLSSRLTVIRDSISAIRAKAASRAAADPPS